MSSTQGANPTSLVPVEQDTSPTTLPPPYTGPTPAEEDLDAGDEEYNQQPPASIYINCSTIIRGSQNVVTKTPWDTIQLAATVMAVLRDTNSQITANNTQVRIDRGVNIVGERNLVGAFGLRPRQPPVAANTTTAPRVAAPRKRKAEEQSDGTPEAKKASARAMSCPPS